jgi:hypothetical protein
MKPAKFIAIILFITSIILLVIFLFWHWKLGLVRYFDVDEYAHLHYAAQIIMGKKPYVDFLSFFPPGFAWFLTPAILIGWGTIQPFITARIMTFFIFLGMCTVSGLIFWEMRKKIWGAVLAAMLLAFLPMPLDKYLEIRPDNLATLLILIAVYFQIIWLLRGPVAGNLPGKPTRGPLPGSPSSRATPLKVIKEIIIENQIFINPLVSGLAYGLAYLVLPKMLPNIALGVGIAILFALQNHPFKKKTDLTPVLLTLKPFLIGLGAPLLLLVLWALSLGKLGIVIYSFTALLLESNKISQYFIMMPNLFFYPNGTFYGVDGWSRGLLVNHAIWVMGLFFAIYRLVTAYLPNGKKQFLAEVLMAASLVMQVIFYVKLVPLKHTQYLIPIGIFIAWYAADLLVAIFHQVGKIRYGKVVYTGVYIVAAIFLYQTYIEVNQVKLSWSNTKPLTDIADMYKRIPVTDQILDLDGRMLYNPDAYYACCIPFGQFAGFLSKPLPDLPTILEQNRVKYINQGELQRVNTLPGNWQQYIYSHYHSDSGNNTFLIRNDISQ